MSPPALADLARRLAATALVNVAREYPYASAQVLTGPGELALPRDRHPAFWGAYDWHSSVHLHWLLASLLRRVPDRVDGPAVRSALRSRLTPAALQVEADRLRADPSFERPYGWAWLARLAAECAAGRDDPDLGACADALRPAADTVADLVTAWLARAAGPVRSGTHADSAFALGLLLDATGPLGQPALAALLRETALRWYVEDRDAPAAWEPSGEDFLSPSLTEADLVRRVLPPAELPGWLATFLPGLAHGEPVTLLSPVPVPDRTDGRTGHLDGLALSRAAHLRSLGAALPHDDVRRPVLERAADAHLEAGLASLDEPGFLSTHWLSTFAALALG